MTKSTDRTALTVSLPAKRHRQLRSFAALTDSTMNAVMEAAIERYVAECCPDEGDRS
jgi:predicted transcriptional regulator